MINLIPYEERKKKLQDFYFRLLVTALMIMGFSMLAASAAILPAYFFSSVQKNLVRVKLNLQSVEPLPAPDPGDEGVSEDIAKKLALIKKVRATKYPVSEKVIAEILKDKMSDIKITQILYQFESGKGKIISINGTASSRERLLLFKQALSENNAFRRVDLPISNFVKGEDINFSLSLIPS